MSREMNSLLFKERTKRFAIEIIRMVETLPRTRTADIIGRQLIRSGTSIGANYRAACRSRSRADMIAKLKIVEEEGDETLYWMELLQELGLISPSILERHISEANQIVAMIVRSIKTLRTTPGKYEP